MTVPQGEERKKVLVVDDEPHVRKYLKTILQDAGYEAVSASDGHKGLKAARREKPNLIVLDLVMPRQTGTDFYRNMVKDRELSNIPIIVVSAVGGRELAVKRPAAVFDKPIDPEAFISAVERALE